MRIGVASIVQESNTFAVSPTSFRDFEIYGIFCGDTITEALAGTNSEIWGAIEALQTLGVEPVPLVRAWAMSGGRAQHDVFVRLQHMLLESIAQAGRLDGVVLSLHGAWVAEGEDAADASIAEAVRAAVGPDTVVGVCLDLHANLTQRLIDATDVITAFHTYPHVDQADTGRRIARLVRATAEGSISPVCRIAKRPMLVPAEAQREDGPFGELRRLADDQTRAPVLDISLFPVQPWLDVPELGFGVTVAVDRDELLAAEVAGEFAERAWALRHCFSVKLISPQDAIERARRTSQRPVLLIESADSPTAGAAGDSPAMIRELLPHAATLRALLTVVDAAGVAACHDAGEGAGVELDLGATVDHRFHSPTRVLGTVARCGNSAPRLTGPVWAGLTMPLGRWAVVNVERLSILITERPAATFDPETFRHVGLDPLNADIVVVRSATLWRATYPAASVSTAMILDLPGASTPRLDSLELLRAPKPLFPIDATTH
jgi:microcystin degradation protein MlrC